MQIEAIRNKIEADLKMNGCTVRKLVPDGNEQITDLKAYFMKKYLSQENICLILFVDVMRNGRTNEEIEQMLQDLKIRTIQYVDSQSPVKIADRLEIKTRYKII